MTDIVSIENNQKEILLKKHVNAIHCTNNITLVQRKIANVLLYNAYHDLMKQATFTISIKLLCDMIGYHSRNYKLLQQSLEGLCTTGLTWGVLNDSDDKNNISWTVSSFLSAVTLGNGICTYEYSNALKKVLYKPERYGEINLDIQSRFTSSIGLALYETCARFSRINQTGWLTMVELREIMGISSKKYPRYRDFKQKVVIAAVKEVNEKSNLIITFKERVEGKIASNINFLISKKELPLACSSPEEKDKVSDAVSILINEFGVKEQIALRLLQEYGDDYINEKLFIVKESAAYKSGKIASLAGVVVSAISNNYTSPRKSKASITEQSQNKASSTQLMLQKKKEQELLNTKYQEYISVQVKNYLELISEYERTELNNDFISNCRNTRNILALKKAENGDLESPSVKYVYNRFVIDNYLQGRVMSKELFIKNG